MRKGFLGVYYPQNATEQSAVPTGAMAILPGEVEVKIKQDTGTIESVSGGGGGGASGKSQLTTAGANAVKYALHNGKEVHAEALVTSVTMALTDFQVSGANVFGSFWLFNYSGITLPVTLGAGWIGGISEDGEVTNDLVGAGTLLNLPHTMKALIIFDTDGYVRASILGSEITQAEFNTGLAGKMNVVSIGTIDANSIALLDNTVYVGNGTAAATNVPGSAFAWTLTNYKMATFRHQVFRSAENVEYIRTGTTFTDNVWTQVYPVRVSATDRILGRSTAGAGTVEEITCTAAGRALLDDADATAQRTTMGLGTLATKSTVVSTDMFDGITMRRNELKRRLPKWSNTVLAVDCNVDFTDLSNAPTTLTTNGTVAFAADTNGIGTQVADFAGATNSVTETAIDLNGHSFSVACWYKKAAVGDFGYIIGQTGAGATNNTMLFGYNGVAATFSLVFWGNDLNYTSAPNDTNWHHAVGTYDTLTNLQTLYIDGVSVATRTSTSDLLSNKTIYIGRSEGNGEWGGLVQQAVIWDNTVLTATEVYTLYSKNEPTSFGMLANNSSSVESFLFNTGIAELWTPGKLTRAIDLNFSKSDLSLGALSTIVNTGSLGGNAQQATGDRQPSIIDTDPTGLKCCAFDGVNDFLQSSIAWQLGTHWALFAVYRYITTGQNRGLISDVFTGDNAISYFLGFDNAAGENTLTANSIGGAHHNGVWRNSSANAYTAGNFGFHFAQYDGVNVANKSNGGTTLNTAQTSDPNGVQTTLTNIGADWNTTPTDYSNVRIFRIIGFVAGTGLSADTIERLEGWAAWTYGQQALLPTSHTYRYKRPLA